MYGFVCVFGFRLLVPVQVMAWKDSSVMCQARHKTTQLLYVVQAGRTIVFVGSVDF